MKKSKADALIIGSGVGGLCVAARLVEKGMKVVLAEKLPFVGGRFSSRDVNGYQITTGAIMVPFGERSSFQETFDLLNATMNVRETKGAFRYRLKHGEYDAPKEGGGGLMGMLSFAMKDDDAAREVFQEFVHALSWWEPCDRISFRDWLAQYTNNTEVHNMFQGFCGAFIGVNSNEVPAGEFFRFMKAMGRNNKYGISVNGNLELMDSLADKIRERDSRVHTSMSCKQIVVERGRVRGAILDEDGVEEFVEAKYVISNAGPNMTVKLAGEENFEQSYMTLLKEHQYATPVVHVCLTSNEPLTDFDGILNFGNTRRLVFMEFPTMTCPELAPEGKHITTTFSVPKYSSGPLNMKETIEMVMLDLDDNFPSFKNNAKPLMIATHHGEWPAMRRWPGYPMPVRTPIGNLYNAGDGCMPLGTVGIEAAAISAKQVADEITKK